VKEKGILDRVKAQQLQETLLRIPRRTVKDCYERIIGDGNKLADALRRLEHELQKKNRDAFNMWKTFTVQ
jgi:hypothetical protein